MGERPSEHQSSMLIGPGFEPRLDAQTECEVGEPDHRQSRAEGRRLLVRLVVAFVAIVGIAVLCFGVLPAAGSPYGTVALTRRPWSGRSRR